MWTFNCADLMYLAYYLSQNLVLLLWKEILQRDLCVFLHKPCFNNYLSGQKTDLNLKQFFYPLYIFWLGNIERGIVYDGYKRI